MPIVQGIALTSNSLTVTGNCEIELPNFKEAVSLRNVKY